MTKPAHPRRRNRARSHQDGFRETLAAPLPNQAYRSEIDLIGTRPSAIEQTIRVVALILSLLLLGRLIINLFTTDTTNGYAGFFSAATNWMTWPFELIFGQPPVNNTGGFFDWPAVIAMVAISLIAGLIVRVIRPAP